MLCPEFPEKVPLLFHCRIVKEDHREQMHRRYSSDFLKNGKNQREHLNHDQKYLTGYRSQKSDFEQT